LLGLLTVPSVSGLFKKCGRGDTCGKFLSVYDKHSIKRTNSGDGTCEEKCVLFPSTRTNLGLFFRKYRGWECGSCKAKNEETSLVSLNGPSSNFTIIACDAETLTVRGDLVDQLQVGNRVLYVDGAVEPCEGCNHMFRRITAITENGTLPGSKVLATELLTMADVYGPDDLDPTLAGAAMEKLFNCSDSSRRRQLQPGGGGGGESHGGGSNHAIRQLQQGVCKPNWLQKNADGRCSRTNCFVGTKGDPNDCFECGTKCDNSCGGAGKYSPKFSGDFFFYDFGPACCNHDHCWSSTFSRRGCDVSFYMEMLSACPYTGIILFTAPVTISCTLYATLFYLFVSSPIGSNFHASAQRDQKLHEAKPICIAQCPSTQKSGGQGTTTLTIDLLRLSGKFEVTYDMFTVPDELTITYEGNDIFSTGGLVAGARTTTVSYAGNSTVIQVTINAPLDGTQWDVFVGCPTDL
jgi:hypothetical protein